MDEIVKTSIKSRKDAIFNYYDVDNKKIIEDIDNLFSKIDALGEECKDATEFESKFASSPLNGEYADLFAKIATKCKLKNIESSDDTSGGTIKDEILDDVGYEIKEQISSKHRAERRLAREEADKKIRNIPIIGDALTAKQHMDLFNKFRRKK